MLSMSYMYDWQVGDEDVGIIMSTIANVICSSLLIVASLCSIFHLALICVVMGMSRNDLHNSLNTEVIFFFQGTPLERMLWVCQLWHLWQLSMAWSMMNWCTSFLLTTKHMALKLLLKSVSSPIHSCGNTSIYMSRNMDLLCGMKVGKETYPI